MKYRNLIVVCALAITACTTTDEIIIDEKGIDMNAYQRDLADCRRYGEQVKTGEKTAKGAASGAVVGGLGGAIFGGSSGAATGAGIGALGGGVQGANEGERTEIDVVKRCLAGRGYRLLN